MRLGLIWGETFNGLRRNFSMAISVILVTFVSLSFVGVAILMQMQIGAMKDYWYDKAQVAIYMCTVNDNCAGGEASQDSVDAVRSSLQSPELAVHIERFYFETREESYKRFQEQFKGTDIAGFITQDMTPQTFWVNLQDPNQSAVIIESFTGQTGVQSVVDQRSYLDGIFRVLNVASLSAIGVALIMLVAAVLLISTTIRLSVFSRRREIAIMRLVGASNRFIRIPFILEGVLAAFIGAVLSSITIYGLVSIFILGYLREQFPLINFIGLQQVTFLTVILLVAGVLLAASSAGVAIKRYLKV